VSVVRVQTHHYACDKLLSVQGQDQIQHIIYDNAKRACYGALSNTGVTDIVQVFTSYSFNVLACNRLGCVSSDSVTLTTAALAPHLVYPPTLQVLGSHHAYHNNTN